MLKLALRNIFRQKLRSAMTLAAIIFGVVGLILSGGFVEDIVYQLGETTIHSQSGHLQIYKTGFFAEGSRAPDKYLIDQPETVTDRVRLLPEVEDTMARVNFSGLLNNGRSDLSVVGEGVEPDKEARLGSHLRISAGRHLGKQDDFGPFHRLHRILQHPFDEQLAFSEYENPPEPHEVIRATFCGT